METNRKTWTLEEIAARRATGDSLVAHDGWSASYDTCPPAKSATLHLERHASVQDSFGALTYDVVEVDARDGHVFSTSEDAELYALNRGCLVWYRDWQAQKTDTERRQRHESEHMDHDHAPHEACGASCPAPSNRHRGVVL